MASSKYEIRVRQVGEIAEVDPAVWDALEHGASPFQRHGFLLALERSGSVGPGSGWMPSYLLAEKIEREGSHEQCTLLGASCAYLKGDSYGEYIFDWAWARAAGHFGVPYYPKLTVAAPFTPATGRRFLCAPGADRRLVMGALLRAFQELCDAHELSGAHVLFCEDKEAEVAEEAGLARRASMQFHWHNRGYASMDDFLAALKSRKRKQIRKERRTAAEACDEIDFVAGSDIGEEDLACLDRYYRKTVYAHGGIDYLRPGFFAELVELMPEYVRFARARKQSKTIAGALFFETEEALYGRYWGADKDCEFLHFELAYYSGIERCIAQGLQLFEAGAQGEHKLLRGFEPAMTHSVHWMRDANFDRAVRGFLVEEDAAVRARMEQLAEFGPYRHDDG